MFEGLQEKLERTLKVLRGEAKIRSVHIEGALQEIRTTLLEADVHYEVVNRFLEQVQKKALGSEVLEHLNPHQQFLKILREEMLLILGSQAAFDLAVKPPAIVFMVGLQGSGKTTSSVKLAWYAKKKLKRTPLLVSVDVKRPAAMEQLERLAKEVKLDVFSHASLQPLERAISALQYAQTYGLDFLVVDTAGRLSIDEAMMEALQHLSDTLKPHFVLYVADSMSGQAGLQVAEDFSKRVKLTGAIITKADSDSRGGIAFSIREALHVPLQFMGHGEKIENFEVFYPNRYVSRLLGLGDLEGLFEKAEEVVSGEAPAKEQAQKMMKGQFTLKDFQEQMKMMSKMGSMKSIIGMIPGASQAASKINMEDLEKRLKKIDAMIHSMTLKERENPDVIDGGRRRRIASGSGTKVENLNQFLSEFYEMKRLMKRFGSGKMPFNPFR